MTKDYFLLLSMQFFVSVKNASLGSDITYALRKYFPQSGGYPLRAHRFGSVIPLVRQEEEQYHRNIFL